MYRQVKLRNVCNSKDEAGVRGFRDARISARL